MIVKYVRGADHTKMLAGAVIWIIFDLPLAWLLGPAMVGLLLAIHSKPVGTDYFLVIVVVDYSASRSGPVSLMSTLTGC